MILLIWRACSTRGQVTSNFKFHFDSINITLAEKSMLSLKTLNSTLILLILFGAVLVLLFFIALNSTLILLISYAKNIATSIAELFKFHFDSINMIHSARRKSYLSAFKFHFDSINITLTSQVPLNWVLFKFHFDSINIISWVWEMDVEIKL